MNRTTVHSVAVIFGVALSVAAVTWAACTRVEPGNGRPAAAAATAKEAPAPGAPAPVQAQVRPIDLEPSKAQVGDAVQVSAQGLPPGATIDLVWETVKGGWVVEGYYKFRGKKYEESSQVLGKATVGPDGGLAMRFTTPEDYGGIHNVVAMRDGVRLAQGALDLTQSFELTPAEGPVGTPIELRVKGLGYKQIESTWVVNWDNQAVGWVSAADTNGTATARFRAAGPTGDHHIKVYTGWAGQAYLNFEQAPNAYLPRPGFVFRTTPGSVASAAFVEPYPVQPVPPAEGLAPGARLDLAPRQGPVGSPMRLMGGGFAPNTPLALSWETWVGSRVSGTGYAPKSNELRNVTTGPDGSLDVALSVPDDLGGLHALTLKSGDRELGRVFYAIETSIVGIHPTSGPVGTPVSIHLRGVGWTEYDNILIATYDNAYMGYACGFNSQGDVVVNFTAAGTPGIHLIDLYPGIYQGPQDFPQQLYRLPQLTYADDHPGNKIPALRFAFEITG